MGLLGQVLTGQPPLHSELRLVGTLQATSAAGFCPSIHINFQTSSCNRSARSVRAAGVQLQIRSAALIAALL
jgi:hypothetical protein